MTALPLTFGQQLCKVRNEAGMSSYRLAVASGFDHSHISRLQSGERNPSREAVLRIAEVMRCTPLERDRLLVLAGHMPEGDGIRKMIYLSLWGEYVD